MAFLVVPMWRPDKPTLFENPLDLVVAPQGEADVVGNQQAVFPRHLFALDLLQLGQENEGVQDAAIADDVDGLRAEQSGGNGVEKVLVVADLNGVAGVGAAVEAGDDVVLFGKQVDQLALALVAPLRPKHGADLGVQAVHAGLFG